MTKAKEPPNKQILYEPDWLLRLTEGHVEIKYIPTRKKVLARKA